MTDYRAGRLRVADGLSLAWRDYGDPLSSRLPLLCLAGLSRHAGDFHDFAQALAPRRVVTLDLRGRGDSDWDPTGNSYRPEIYVDDARQLLAAKGLGRVVACGTSLGGYLSMGLAIIAPTVLAGVIMNDAGPDPDTAALADISGYLAELAQSPPPDWPSAHALVRQRFAKMHLREERDWDSFTRGTFRERDGRLQPSWDPGIGRALKRQPPPRDLWPLFGALRPFPTLLLRGERSQLLRADTAERMRALHPRLDLVTVPGAGHAPTLLEPESRAAVDDFLERLDRRACGLA